ncbi:substrate-binding periplasmic protein [Oceanicoccus sagamiensis]|uniref:Uncharacterized protein n=1 Tax=Oceanicoccus sagamiensis TaxID=716816 RepID=A0A1X9NJW4_9GAMM|nr:transporter substrate-binding domain-containing protein [Oceanicoccus sagamiensis]ARN75157.1 hypothetical protein BST96_14155 [Oceanicoccus sagamiensis]
MRSQLLKGIKTLGLWIALLIIISSHALGQSETPPTKKTTLIFGTANWCPYICDPAHDKLARRGYMIDLLDSIFRDSAYHIKIEMMTYMESIVRASRGELDGIIGTLPLDAPQLIYPSQEIGVGTDIFVTREDSQWFFKQPESLAAVRLGVVKGYEYKSLKTYKEKYQNTEQLQAIGTENSVNTTLRNLQKLFNHEIDAVLDNSEVIKFTSTIHNLAKTREAGQLEDPYAMWLALSPHSKHWQEICKIQNHRLLELRKTGALDFILRRYGLEDWRKEQHNLSRPTNLPGIIRCH